MHAVEHRLEEVRRGPRGRHVPPGQGPETDVLRRWIVRELVHEEIVRRTARRFASGSHRIDDRQTDDRQTDDRDRPPSTEEIARVVELATRDVQVEEADVRGYYDRNPDLFRRPAARRVRHVLLADEAGARDVAALLWEDADMATLARERSLDRGSRDSGGDMGDIRRGELSGPFEDAVFAAAVGDVLGPIRTEHGWHVARVEATTPPSRLPYDDARAEIEAELLAAARLRSFDAWLERRVADLAVFEAGYEHPGDPASGVRTHRH